MMQAVYVFVLGLCAGSFLNAFLYRLERQESVMRGRSRCPHCSHALSWLDLIPIASFLLLRGTCRYCKGPISWQYPVVELSTALVFLLIFNSQFLISNEFLFLQYLKVFSAFFIASALIGIFVYDFKHYIIPDRILFPAIAVAFMYQVLNWLIGNFDLIKNLDLEIRNLLELGSPILVASIASAFFFALHFVSRGTWMGFADGKLVFLLGLILGWPLILPALFSAFLSGAVIGMILITYGKKTLKSEVPFGPFLVGGTFFAMFLGNFAIAWYLRLLYWV